LEQAYQFIQEYSNYVTPGAFALFSLGLFWKKTTSNAAIVAAVLTLPLSILFKALPTILNTEPIPFLDRTMWVYGILVFLMVLISLYDGTKREETKGLLIDKSMFKVSDSFLVFSVLICGILAALYTVFW
jgi:solute:Na+ symporter, SSS family